jgi:hypothetical protein
MALLANAWLLAAMLPPKWSNGIRRVVVLVLAVVVTISELLAFVVIAFNAYGT